MEIKRGDKVRVSGHYLAIMIADGIVHNALNNATFVVDNINTEGRMAYVSCELPISLQSPIAHLIKVDAEARERKIKCGDKVLAMKTDQIAPSSEAETFRRNVSLVTKIKNGIASLFIIDRYGANHYARTAVEFLQKVTDESTEQTEAHTDANEQLQEEYMRFMKNMCEVHDAHIRHCGQIYTQDDFINDYDPSKHEVNPNPRYIPKIMFNTEFWVKYEADLAHDLAVQMVKCNRNNYDKIGNMAVRVAKSVVENLKQK